MDKGTTTHFTTLIIFKKNRGIKEKKPTLRLPLASKDYITYFV